MAPIIQQEEKEDSTMMTEIDLGNTPEDLEPSDEDPEQFEVVEGIFDDDPWEQRIEKDEEYRRDLSLLFKELRSHAISNVEYYQELGGTNQERFFQAFQVLYMHLDEGIEPGVLRLIQLCHLYDVDPQTPANGYRSIIQIIHKCCIHILQLSRHVSLNRKSFTFRGNHYSQEVEAYVTVLGQLRACLFYLLKLTSFNKEGDLFNPDLDAAEKEYCDNLMQEVESLSQEPFYGRCLGFQFCESIVNTLTTISTAMAGFADSYYKSESSAVMKLATSVIGGSKYYFDPELRAQKVVSATRNGDVAFCKAFWDLAENSIMHTLPLFICPPVQVDNVINIEPEPFEMEKRNGNTAVITPPSAHTGPAPLPVRLISHKRREGQNPPSKSMLPKSKGLIIHFHGGGFVAQSSASHEVYLRHWAKETDIPILSVDYSLAPENPFPRQVEEGFYAYCWALKNCEQLGTTADKVVLCGDSAGANLAVLTAIQAIEHNVRIPDGILSSYGCMLVQYVPSPSRILALMDPLLPIGILSQCLAAYAGVTGKEKDNSSDINDNGGHALDSDKFDSEPKENVIERGDLVSVHDKSVDHASQRTSHRPPRLDLASVTSDQDGSDRPMSPSLQTSPRSPMSPNGLRIPHSPTSPNLLALQNDIAESLQPTTPTYAKTHVFPQSPIEKYAKTSLKPEPRMSPYQFSDEVLVNLPPVYFVVCKLDPILDDSIMFARRLKGLNVKVEVDVLEDLPHGFLNFVLVSQDAKKGSGVCEKRLKEMLCV